MICGKKSCLAGDILASSISRPKTARSATGFRVQDARLYNGQKNWFNGVQMPSIAIASWHRAIQNGP